MMGADAETLREAVLEALQGRLEALQVPREEIDGSFDLFGSGLLDSMAFVDLLVELEEGLGIKLDLERMDFNDLASLDALLGQLCRIQQGMSSTND